MVSSLSEISTVLLIKQQNWLFVNGFKKINTMFSDLMPHLAGQHCLSEPS